VTAGTGLSCGSGSTFTALGVTMVFLDQAPFAPASGCTLDLSAPDPTLTATGLVPYPGMLIYFARTNTSSLTMWSGSGTTISGSIYAKAGSLTVQGGSVTGTAIQSMIVVDNINVKARSYLSTAYASSLNVILRSTKAKVSLVQ
jgi:hypothetical protein